MGEVRKIVQTKPPETSEQESHQKPIEAVLTTKDFSVGDLLSKRSEIIYYQIPTK